MDILFLGGTNSVITESDKLCMEWGGRDAGRERECTQDEEVRKADEGGSATGKGGEDAWIRGEQLEV